MSALKRGSWPERIVGTESLLGVLRRYAPEALDVRVPQGDPTPGRLEPHYGKGARAILAAPGEATDQLLAGLDRKRWEVFALVPNVPQYVRDSSDLGLMGAAVARVKRASPMTLARLGLTGLANAGRVLAKDFAGMLCLLLELEAARMQHHRPRAVFLASALTDLALSAGNRDLFQHYVRYIHGRFGVPAGLETHNLGHLLARLREWQISVDVVVGPVNPAGYMMKPDPESVLRELRMARCAVLAKETGAGATVPVEEGNRFARGAGAAGCVVDLVDL